MKETRGIADKDIIDRESRLLLEACFQNVKEVELAPRYNRYCDLLNIFKRLFLGKKAASNNMYLLKILTFDN